MSQRREYHFTTTNGMKWVAIIDENTCLGITTARMNVFSQETDADTSVFIFDERASVTRWPSEPQNCRFHVGSTFLKCGIEHEEGIAEIVQQLAERKETLSNLPQNQEPTQ